MNLTHQLLALAAVHLLAVSSPGPDFIAVTRNTILGSRRAGLFTAIGIVTSNIFHLAAAIFISNYLGAHSHTILNVLRILGAGYLGWIGAKCLFGKSTTLVADGNTQPAARTTLAYAFLNGFTTCLLNARAGLYFLSITSQFIQIGGPLWINLVFVFEFLILTGIWFSFVALTFGNASVRKLFSRKASLIERCIGISMMSYSALMASAVFYGN